MTGTLYGIGVGPGDPELMTVKAYRRLKEADVIAYPKKGGKAKAMPNKLSTRIWRRRKNAGLGFIFR